MAERPAAGDQDVVLFFEACARGDVDAVRGFLARESGLARLSNPRAPHPGWTGLHSAARGGHVEAVRVLLEHGADPNAREAGDNTYPLHWAAAHGHLETVRTLLDAGADVHGVGDVHHLDVIGWATFYHAPGDQPARIDAARQALVSLLLGRGARHHIFSAMSVGDLDLIRQLVEETPGALDRRMSRFERRQTPLHFAIERKRYDVLSLLIELGADLEAEDATGQTALTMAILRGDRETISRLQTAGAKPPTAPPGPGLQAGMASLAGSVTKGVPMIVAPDVARALDWYVSVGFKEEARYDDDGVVNFGMVSFGKAEVMLNMYGKPGGSVSLWFYTNEVDQLYKLLKSRQIEAAAAALAGGPIPQPAIEFSQDIEDMFYGARQFAIRDLHGYELYFIQSASQ